MATWKRKIYEKLPTFFKNTANYIYGRIPYSVHLGKEYVDTLKILEREEYKSEVEHIDYQFKELKKILVYSYENVPYYKRVFDEVKFNPYEMTDFSDIEKIPFLTKEIIEDNYQDLISTEVDKKYITINTTSGTSGRQLRFGIDTRTYYSREWAFIHHIWKRIGYVEGKSSIAALRNEVLPEGKLYEFDNKTRRLILDTYHLTDESCAKIIAKLEKDNIEFIHTFPSAITVLCKYLIRSGGTSYSPKAIIVTSETLYEEQKRMIEECFHTRVFTFYGHSERAALASWCEKDDLYHIQTEYGYVELVDDSGHVINENEVIGEIVCTGFHNLAMPLIRYKTADYASYSEKKDCPCGRHYRSFTNIYGRRNQDALIGKDDNLISDSALNMHSMIYQNVDKFQFVQNEKGKCDLLIVKGDTYTDEDEKIIYEEINKKVGDTIDLSIVYVDDIQRTKAGKYRYLIRNIEL